MHPVSKQSCPNAIAVMTNLLAATNAKCHISCACHRLSTSINTAWEMPINECDELATLDTNSNNVVKLVKKSGGIQYNNLPATLKIEG